MAEYLFLFRGGADMSKQSPADLQANMKQWTAWIEGLAKQGKFTGGQPLGREGKVMKGARRTVTDGPFAEAKDIVGGYLIVKAGSLDEATELATGCPVFQNEGGSVEVRPIQTM